MLDRQFTAERPNQKWIADFTYIWTAEGWLYVAAVIDLFSRRVVGWSMKAEMNAQLVADALVMAIWRRGKPDALLHHSDQGSQYTSQQFQTLMNDNCENAWNVGSGAKLVHIKRLCGDKASAKEIEVRSPVHLPFDELQLGDLPLDLAV